jgi:glutathione S-transferase
MNIRLFDWGPSPFCLKVRAILDHKQVPYERINVMGRPLLELRRRGGIGKVPALEIDGSLVCDSTDIAHELERRFPHPAILPSGERERGLCHALEDWADEAIYFVGLYFQWIEPAGKALAPRAFGRGPLGRAAIRYSSRLIRRQALGQGIGRKPEEMVRADLERQLDAATALVVPGPFLLGAEPLLCDFALMSQLVYLSRTPVGGARVQARPDLGAYLDRMKQLRAGSRQAA